MSERFFEKHEKRLAERTGGKRTKGSGNQPGQRGDINTEDFKIEAKSTSKKSISIKLEYLVKISHEALSDVPSRKPALAITFEDAPGWIDEDWILIPYKYFEDLKRCSNGLDDD